MNISENHYKKWILELKNKIRSTQIKAAIAVNSALIEFYWELGKMISEKENVWGNKLIEQVAKDLQSEFPDMKGLSRSNLFYCKQFYLFYHEELIQQAVGQFMQQTVGQIPWGHNILVFSKSKNVEEAFFTFRRPLRIVGVATHWLYR
ncbi:DUF1016 N-terminal domain-containing protein [Bacteroidales bacterium OttesenSCG-928-B11]|nr:DUF1016 N-terminal domain-containing protein [Bacteroidales bacterium OttesenSCG-928-C03]MDL2312108.1 DUF1016 N-terminal domain-containing protein [Bacteroidales bacterium OttesenSCG-928-B11]MDL2326081.1 DUF1016 N-terminal domain-containing protein [Bacteroidales bacterium OttesenSCG-928-A14]